MEKSCRCHAPLDPPASPAAIAVIWMTCASDGREHAVSEVEIGAGVRRGRGRYRAICRADVLAPSMIAPPGRQCADCLGELACRSRTPRRQPRVPRWIATISWGGQPVRRQDR